MADVRQLWFCHNQLSINCARLQCKSNLNLRDFSMSFYCNRLSLHYIHTYMEILQNCGNISRKNVFEIKVFDKLSFILRQLHSGFVEEVTHGRAATNSSSSVFLHLTDRCCPYYRDYMVTFEPISLKHVALNVQMHCHIVYIYDKQQKLELLSLIFECTHQLPPSCQSKYKYKHNCK